MNAAEDAVASLHAVPNHLQPQWAHVGASAWMAHSKLSKT
jgi:hypothetical protein